MCIHRFCADCCYCVLIVSSHHPSQFVADCCCFTFCCLLGFSILSSSIFWCGLTKRCWIVGSHDTDYCSVVLYLLLAPLLLCWVTGYYWMLGRRVFAKLRFRVMQQFFKNNSEIYIQKLFRKERHCLRHVSIICNAGETIKISHPSLPPIAFERRRRRVLQVTWRQLEQYVFPRLRDMWKKQLFRRAQPLDPNTNVFLRKVSVSL